MWVAYAAFTVAHGQSGTYAARLVWIYGGAFAVASLYLIKILTEIRHLYRLPPESELQLSDSLWTIANVILVPASFILAIGVLVNTMAAASFRAATLGNLNAIRSAVSLYYGDNDKRYPRDLTDLTEQGKYLASIPEAKLGLYHPSSSAVHLGAGSNDSGGWLYNNVPSNANFGTVLINCSHSDWKGNEWTSY